MRPVTQRYRPALMAMTSEIGCSADPEIPVVKEARGTIREAAVREERHASTAVD
jgi:hypothetical protein